MTPYDTALFQHFLPLSIDGKTMGLEIVEVVLAVEDHFRVSLRDDLLSRMRTVGDLHRLVLDELSRLERPAIQSSVVLHELREIIAEQMGFHFDDVTVEKTFVRDLGID